MKLNILFLICIFAIFTIAYSKKVDKAVFVATKHHTDDEDERVNEDKGTPSCKRKLAKLQTEQKFWKDKLSKVKAKINKKILKLQYKFEHKGKEEDSQEDSLIEKKAVFLANKNFHSESESNGVRGSECQEKVKELRQNVNEAKAKFKGVKASLNKKLLKLKYKIKQWKNNKNDSEEDEEETSPTDDGPEQLAGPEKCKLYNTDCRHYTYPLNGKVYYCRNGNKECSPVSAFLKSRKEYKE